MDQEPTATGQSARSSLADAPATVVWGAFVGLAAAVAGFIDGIVLMAKSAEGRCYSSTGNWPCKVHPRLGEGLAISAISLGVGAAVLLLAYLGVEVSRRAT